MNDMSNLSNAVVSQSLAGRRLENKSVILTGAAGSIGRYISRHLLSGGISAILILDSIVFKWRCHSDNVSRIISVIVSPVWYLKPGRWLLITC